MTKRRLHLRASRFAICGLSWIVAGTVMSKELSETWESPRSMGMGNASVSTSTDDGSLFSNPAEAGRARKYRQRNSVYLTKVPNLVVGANSESRSLYGATSGSGNAEALIQGASDIGSKPFWFRFGVFPVTMMELNKETPAAIGVYLNSRNKAVIEADSPEQAMLESITDLGTVANIGWSAAGNRFNTGIQIRPTSRYAYESMVETAKLTDRSQTTGLIKDMKSGANRSTAIGVDVGMLYTMPDFWFPTFGASIMNLPVGCRENYLNPFTKKMETVCGTKFVGSFNDPNALSVIDPMDGRMGVSIMPRIARSVTLKLAAEAHHMYVPYGGKTYGLSGVPPTQMLNAGAELFWGNPLKTDSGASIRIGVSEGYYTTGISMEAFGFLLEFASYGRDVSYSGSKAIEDRRYLVGMTSIF